MVRRRMEKAEPRKAEANGDRPSLEQVLDLWGVTYHHRNSQMICCPLHDERHPSCSLNLDKQLWNCHSCGNGGDVWRLIELREETDFAGALAYATAESLPAGSAGGSGVSVRGSGRRASGSVASRPRADRGDGGYTPSWRRRGSGTRA